MKIGDEGRDFLSCRENNGERSSKLFGVFPVAEGGRKLTNDVGRSPESFVPSLPQGRVLKGTGSLYLEN